MVPDVHTHKGEGRFLPKYFVKVSLAPTPQEGHSMWCSWEKQHAQEPKQPMVCDWNHLPLSVTVTAEPTLEPGHDLESQKKTFEYDDQNATKITSALEDKHSVLQTSDIKFCRVLCAYLFLVIIFLTMCYLPFLFFQCCNHVVIKLGGYLERKMDTERRSMWWRLLLWLPGVLSTPHWFGIRWKQNGTSKTWRSTKKCWYWPNIYEEWASGTEPMCEGNDPHLLSSGRVNEVVTGAKRPSYQIRRPIDDDEDDDDDTCLKADVPRMSERSIRFTRLTNKLTHSIRLTGDSQEDCRHGLLSPVRENLTTFFCSLSSRHHLVATTAETTTPFFQRWRENLVCQHCREPRLFFLPATTEISENVQVNAVDTFNEVAEMY